MGKIVKEQKLSKGKLELVSHDGSHHKSIYLETTWGTEDGAFGINISVVGENIIQIDPGQESGVVLQLEYKEGSDNPNLSIKKRD